MDVNNAHLRNLIDKTDEAFKRLLKEPASNDLNNAYELAKTELDQYISALKVNDSDREIGR